VSKHKHRRQRIGHERQRMARRRRPHNIHIDPKRYIIEGSDPTN